MAFEDREFARKQTERQGLKQCRFRNWDGDGGDRKSGGEPPHLYVGFERDLFTGVGQVALAVEVEPHQGRRKEASLHGDRPPALVSEN